MAADRRKAKEATDAAKEVTHYAVMYTHTTMKKGVLRITPLASFLCGATDGDGYGNKRKVTCPECKKKLIAERQKKL